jgi:alditol oxidase
MRWYAASKSSTRKSNPTRPANCCPTFERELAPFEVRPHWGKLFTIPSAQLQQPYEECTEFKRFVAQCDPHGKFRNEFLSANLYG